jgi:hypothetical protein
MFLQHVSPFTKMLDARYVGTSRIYCKGRRAGSSASFIDVGNILLNFLFVFLIKSETFVVAAASPFFHMRDVHYRRHVSFQLDNIRFKSLVPPRLLEAMLTSF